MQDRVCALFVGGLGHTGPEDEILQECHATGVLHRSGVELRDEELVVLGEGVGNPELLLEERETLLGQFEDVLAIEVLGKGCTAVDAERICAVRSHVFVSHHKVRTSNQRGDVGRHSRGRLKAPRRGTHSRRYRNRSRCVADHLPVIGRRHRQLERCFEVRLLEARVHPSGVGRLELRVQVRLIVYRVDESMQTFTCIHVGAVRDDRHRVVPSEVWERDTCSGDYVARIQLASIEGHRLHVASDQVDPGCGPGLVALEDAGCGAAEGGTRAGEVEIDRVGVDVDQFTALLGLGAGDVLVLGSGSHGPILSSRRRPRLVHYFGVHGSSFLVRPDVSVGLDYLTVDARGHWYA